ncbi:unnamed protein product [Diabrotica balteata]|uniref:Uncharacterized protein LOC114329068 n=2 Tax=Diabrotica TaxID=50385 RepID=A0A6P7FG44_DIAVI|nr:uncharacterized protein LOC114329068 [Diabrotica virgifera virgifera]CAG9826642.1 unnamed protein product [Diabrotica balteata]
MLLQGYNDPPGRQMQRPAGILDSPTLARVERAMLRHEEGTNREGQDVLRAQYTQSLLPSFGKESAHVIKRGLMWQQRDRLFSRWKERYFILTRDYLHVFRRASGSDRISEMGQFLFKVKLIDIVKIEWENKKSYSTVALVLGRDGKIYLRSSEGLEDWFELLEECMFTSKERRKALRYSHNDNNKPRDNNNIPNLDEWIASRQKIDLGRLVTASMNSRQETTVRRRYRPQTEDDDWIPPSLDNRLSLLTDIDISTYDDSTIGTPSVTSYRLSDDVFCVQPPSLRAMGSFRSSRETGAISKRNDNGNIPDTKYFKFRERSYSDIQRV